MSPPGTGEIVPAAAAGERLDRFVALATGCSRSEATELVRSGGVRVGGAVVLKGAHRVEEGDVVELAADPRRREEPPGPEVGVGVEVVYEDDQVVVVDKPPGLVVHPAPGNQGGTLVNGLLARYPELAAIGEPGRPGIVHRLDRQTSGLLVVARTPEAYEALVDQMADHSAQRTYTALVLGHPRHPSGVIDAPIGRSRRDPMRMTVAMDGRWARTHYRVDRRFDEPREAALLTCELETGRTHQIRVHLASIGHPVAGDDRYGGSRPGLGGDRPFLHARRLAFRHPTDGSVLELTSPLPADLEERLGALSQERPAQQSPGE